MSEQGVAMVGGKQEMVFVRQTQMTTGSCCRRRITTLTENLGKQWIDVFVGVEFFNRHSGKIGVIPGNGFRIVLPIVGLNFILMIVIVGKGIVDLSQREIIKTANKLLRSPALFQNVGNNRSDREFCSGDDRGTAAEALFMGDMDVILMG